jgi:chromosome partitioning protein
MQGRVFCIASAKGGSGKTVITAAFGKYLAALGKKVLLIDTDAATNGLSLLYLNEVVTHRDEIFPSEYREQEKADLVPLGMFDAAVGRPGVINSLELDEGLWLLPATYSFLDTESVGPGAFEDTIGRVLDMAREKYDFVFLDAQAGADSLAAVSMRPDTSDVVVIVSEYDPLSAGGVERLKSFFPASLTFDRTWILLNKVLPELSSALGDFLQVARYLSPIPWTADVVRAYVRRQLALDLERGNDYTLAVTQTIKGMVGEDIRTEIDEWLESRATALREPVHDQIRDLEVEAEGLVIERARIEKQQGIRRMAVPVAIAYVLVAAGIALFSYYATASLLPTTVALAVVFSATLLAFSRENTPSTERLIQDARLRRREQLVEERLQKLQTLADAKPEELLSSGN